MSERVRFMVAMLDGDGKKSETPRQIVALPGDSSILATS
jgi:hypothetical protein